jgi:predicted acetyltransferase
VNLESDITLEAVDNSNKLIIDRLWQFYELESTSYSKEDVDESARFSSLDGFFERLGTEREFDWGFIVRYKARIAGLLFIGNEYLAGKPIKEFSDIYILPKYRGIGISSFLIRKMILNSDHPWLICVFREDKAALGFWRNAFERLPFASVHENVPAEIPELHEFIVNDRAGAPGS